MINHPIFVFLCLFFNEKLINAIALLLKNQFFIHKKTKQIKPVDELSPLRNEIEEEEKKMESLKEELTNLLKEAEKYNAPNTFALYSKMQRKSNTIRNKIEEMEHNLEKMKGENESIKSENKKNHKPNTNELSSSLDNDHKFKILSVCLQLVFK